MQNLDVVTFGEAMAMFVADEVRRAVHHQLLYPAASGAETNVAIGLTRLWLQVGWVSRLGDDSLWSLHPTHA